MLQLYSNAKLDKFWNIPLQGSQKEKVAQHPFRGSFVLVTVSLCAA
jgi:hypothetical protein